ncbi:hypothetical protein ACOTHJ_13500 [Achromobacter xylosoxidans]
MQRSPEKMIPATMQRATEYARRSVSDAIKYAQALTTDPEADKRKEECLCQVCYYHSQRYGRVGGAACTSRPCMCCDKVMNFASTLTDVLCKDCAKETDLCCRCGADMNLHERTSWPTPKLREPQDDKDH